MYASIADIIANANASAEESMESMDDDMLERWESWEIDAESELDFNSH